MLLYIYFTILYSSFYFNTIILDAPERWQLNFQDPATPIAEGIITLHHDLMFILVAILFFVIWILSSTLYHFHVNWQSNSYPIVHGTNIELLWTITPALILVVIAIPSFALLYSLDEIIDPTVTINAVGHQWYWSYEYADYASENGDIIAYDSYMIPEEDLEVGQLRMLEVDNSMVVPVNTHVSLIITAADVLHSFAVPSLGINTDAVPGSLNQTSIFVNSEGIYYGQCSEICGVNHAAMPIVVEAVPLNNYISWVSNNIQE